jgi:hypothetical protein
MLPKGFLQGGPLLAGLVFALSMPAFDAVADTSPPGSTGVTVADPAVPRPPGTPCAVQLYSDDTFADFSTHPYTYAPPEGCGTRWSKVVLEADFSVTAGRQFDRTAEIWLDGVNLYYGTTQEPSATVSPSWHVERDLTDYSALLRQAGNGQVILGNVVNDTYTGVLHGSARLLFYPATAAAPAPRVPDAVLPLGSDPVGDATLLDHGNSKLSRSLDLPRNVERAYLDVFAQSQNADEFWYTCVPDQYAARVQECGGGNFREAEVSIDGQPAGVAPVYPWIYTGGIDPYLWRPTPGVQALNFMPYRVDLTPFAGVLSDGNPHEVALSVAGAHHYFLASASLLLYLDPHASRVVGGIVKNTLAGQSPTPTIGDTLVTDADGNVSGDITTGLSRHFVIEGYANTSHGRVNTRVEQTVGFDDTQSFTIDAATYRQVTDQTTSVDSVSQSRVGRFVTSELRQSLRYPLHLDYSFQTTDDGNYIQATLLHQGYTNDSDRRLLGRTIYAAKVSNTVDASDTLDFDANFSVIGHSNQQNMQSFAFHDSLGGCYRKDVASVGGVVTTNAEGMGCPNGQNQVWWFSHPDGSPDGGNSLLGW